MRWPAEWEPHEAVWIGFPGDPAEWPVGLEEAQREVAAFADAICDDGNGEQVLLVCRDEADAKQARRQVCGKVEILIEPFGDVWLRDTGPIISIDNDQRTANDFGFNGWGGKYEMAGDQDIGRRLASHQNLQSIRHNWLLEGGAIDGDGAGRLLTTQQCLLNPNRNADMDRQNTETRMKAALGCSEVIWLNDGLVADHTDGHVDNLARFVSVGKVVVPEADADDDPNKLCFENAVKCAIAAGLTVEGAASVGRYEIESTIVPASYMNFYIGNTVVAVPQYGASNDSKAVKQIGALFPDRKAIGLSSKVLLRGGGSFHCISQQIPAI